MRKNIFSEIHATSMYILNINSIRDLLEDPVSSHLVSNFFFFSRITIFPELQNL